MREEIDTIKRKNEKDRKREKKKERKGEKERERKKERWMDENASDCVCVREGGRERQSCDLFLNNETTV